MSKTKMFVLWDLGIGGIQTLLIDIVTRLVKVEPDTQIVLVLFQHKKEQLKLPKSPQLVIIEHQLESLFFGFTFLRRLIWLCRQIFRTKPSVVISFSTYVSFLTAFATWFTSLGMSSKIKFIISEHILISRYLRSKRFFWRYLAFYSYAMAHKIIVPTQTIGYDLTRNFGVKPTTLVVIKNWVKV